MNSAQKHPIFNNEYEILSSLGEGNTSKVYMARKISNPKQYVALKLLKEEFLSRDQDSIKSVENEIQILQGLSHENIIQIVGYGSDGHIKKPSGREIQNLVFILLEYVTGGLLFDVCQTLGGMGETGGRYFLTQMLDVLEYMHSKGVVHRDLKLENILVDDNMNLKVADFGFATFRSIHKLKSYRGTMTYMAPEIKEGKTYDGVAIDLFSTAVILFIIVQGIFPFKEAKKDEYFYNLILKGDMDTYWKKTGGQSLSKEFKDLIIKMFSYDGKKRPTISEIRAHPWMQVSCDMKTTRHDILNELSEKKANSTAASSREDVSARGELLHELVKQSSVLQLCKFNDMTDFDIDVVPGVIWDDLQSFNTEIFENKMIVEKVENKYIKITIPDSENSEDADKSDIVVKVKFMQSAAQKESEEKQRIRVKFIKKQGDLQKWYEVFNQIREVQMKDILLAPEIHAQ